MTNIDPQLVQFATVRQLELMEAVQKHGSIRAAAKALGIAESGIRKSMEGLRARAARQGYSPEHHLTRPIAPGLKLRGTSQLFKEGQAAPVMEWVKTSADEEARELMLRAAIDAMGEDIPRLPAMPYVEAAGNASLCNCYVITDFHLGMLSHHEETGADWDLKIGEQTLLAWFAQAIAQAPNSRTAVFAQMSDFLTPASLLRTQVHEAT